MRDLTIGDKQIRVRATPLALLYYKQAFSSDLVKDLMGVITGLLGIMPGLAQKPLDELEHIDGSIDTKDMSLSDLANFNIDILTIMQVVWAMARAEAFGKSFPPFEVWLGELGELDCFDMAFMQEAIGEAIDGFFRGGRQQG